MTKDQIDLALKAHDALLAILSPIPHGLHPGVDAALHREPVDHSSVIIHGNVATCVTGIDPHIGYLDMMHGDGGFWLSDTETTAHRACFSFAASESDDRDWTAQHLD